MRDFDAWLRTMPKHDDDDDDGAKVVLSDFGKCVAAIRRRQGMTQRELAAKLGVTDKYIQRIEAGAQNLSIKSLVKLAKPLEVRVREFFYVPRAVKRSAGRPKKRRR